MKIRTGFVSNSSSASFTLIVKDRTMDDFIDDAYEACEFSYFWFEHSIASELSDDIKKIDEQLSKPEKDRGMFFFEDSAKVRKERYENLLAIITDDNAERKDKVLAVLKELHYINVTAYDEFGDIEIECGTTMYNDDHDIPDFIRTMAAYYSRKGIPTRMKVEND